jgi:hypothetical protein
MHSVMSLTNPTISYRVNIDNNSCECLHWKYQRKPIHLRSCKHLDSVRVRPVVLEDVYSVVTYSPKKVKDDYFQLISSHVPRRIHTMAVYVFSEKFDGIRIRIHKGFGTTRRGMVIDLATMQLPFGDQTDDLEYDAELIHKNVLVGGHHNVMKELNRNTLQKLTVKVFDVIDLNLPFQERYRKLTDVLRDDLSSFLVSQRPVESWRQLAQELEKVQSKHGEGLIIRNITSYYIPQKRNSKNVFKLKLSLKIPTDEK